MTVQPSVTVWTILCFLALMLILDRLLFRPLLSFMDKRQEKIDHAREEKAAALREREEELTRREEDRAAAEKRAMSEAAGALDALETENARSLAARKEENRERLAALEEELTFQSGQILAVLESRTDALADAVVKRLGREPAGTGRKA